MLEISPSEKIVDTDCHKLFYESHPTDPFGTSNMLLNLWQLFLAAAGYDLSADSPLLGYPA